ncbi:MAG: DUF3307 domain-containing protein [Pseudomonadota bacterium]
MIFHDLFWLVALHFIADFQLQSDFIAANKIPGRYGGWPFVMTAHAACHGAAVAVILGPAFGAAEFVSHWLIDYAKSRSHFGDGRTGMVIDQALHLALKLVWLGLSLLV